MRQLIVRGPISEGSGYSRALAAHVRHLTPFFDRVLGVDLTPPENRRLREPPFAFEATRDGSSVSDAVKAAPTVLLNYTIPSEFVRHPNAYNVGCFYWETDRFHPDFQWPAYLTLMDALWLPSQHMRAVIDRYGYSGRILEYPWPQTLEERGASVSPLLTPLAARGRLRAQVGAGLHLLGKGARRFGRDTPAFRARQNRFVAKGSQPLAKLVGGDSYYLSVFQAVPRKGLAILLSEWLSFKKSSGSGAWLVLKLSNLDSRRTHLDLLERTRGLLAAQARSAGIPLAEARVALCAGSLDDAALASLFAGSKGVLSASLGEGFGGPIAEAALLGVPVVAPRHTSLGFLIPEDYIFSVEYDELNVALTEQLGNYPLSSRWGVPRPGSLARKLAQLDAASASARAAAGSGLRAHVLKTCSAETLRPKIQQEVDEIFSGLSATAG